MSVSLDTNWTETRPVSVSCFMHLVGLLICQDGLRRPTIMSLLDKCHLENGGCSHKCDIDEEKGVVCSCPDGGFRMGNDSKTCEGETSSSGYVYLSWMRGSFVHDSISLHAQTLTSALRRLTSVRRCVSTPWEATSVSVLMASNSALMVSHVQVRVWSYTLPLSLSLFPLSSFLLPSL